MQTEVLEVLKRFDNEIRQEFSYEKYKKILFFLDELFDIKVINIFEKAFWKSEFTNYNMSSKLICDNISVNNDILLNASSDETKQLWLIHEYIEKNTFQEEKPQILFSLVTADDKYKIEKNIITSADDKNIQIKMYKRDKEKWIEIENKVCNSFRYNSLDEMFNELREELYNFAIIDSQKGDEAEIRKIFDWILNNKENTVISDLKMSDILKLVKYYKGKYIKDGLNVFEDFFIDEINKLNHAELIKILDEIENS